MQPIYGSAEKQDRSHEDKILQEVQMKRFILPLLLSFLFGIILPVAAFAEGSRSITILYTGSVRGTIDPCNS